MLQTLTRSLAILPAFVSGAHAIAGEDVLWQTPYPSASTFHTSYTVVHGGASPRDQEVADDFNATGIVERIVAPGGGCFNCSAPVVDGVWVRFYEWASAGPGALQQEQFVPLNGGFTYTGTYPGQLTINLPQPFEASGWHFISIQVQFGIGGVWDFVQSNRGAPINQPVQFRNNLGDGVWRQDAFFSTPINADVVLTLYGQAAATQPTIGAVSRATVTGSDRIVIQGSDMGAPGNGEFRINGVPGLVRHWSSTKIIGYVPEGLTPGPAQLTVTNLGVASDPMPITIVPREPNGRVKWVFEGDGDYASFAPTVGPNGNIYFNDIQGHLYAMSPDGALLWIVDALLGQQGNADEAPVQVGADGTIYVATNPLGMTVELVAFNPDGSHKWTFTVPNAATWQAGPTIGPDGRLYAALNASTLLGNPYDVLAINPNGTPAWTRAANPAIFEDAAPGQAVIFGPTNPGGPRDQMMFTADLNGGGRNYGFAIDDGQQNFATPIFAGNDVGQGQLAAAPISGDFYMMEFTGLGGLGWGLQAFNADGDRTWRYDPGIASGATRPVVGPNGVIYFGWDLGRLTAVTPDNDEVWTKQEMAIYDEPVPSPTAPMLLALGRESFSQPSFMEARRTIDGEVIWSQGLVDDTGADVSVYTQANFTPSGDAAYFTTLELPLLNESVFRVFAVDTGDAPCPGDLDGDGEVGFNDLNLLLGQYGQSGGGMAGDADGDGDVDFNDLNLLLGVYGEAC